jgi:hypothetical protein
VVGVSARPGDQLTFGQVAAELLDRAECSVLFVADEALASTTAQAGSVAERAEKGAAITLVAA